MHDNLLMSQASLLMDPYIYNIPAALANAYQGKRVIVRSHDPYELAAILAETNPENLYYLQLLSLEADIGPLLMEGAFAPLDLVMSSPASDYPQLYDLAPLNAKYPVRVTMPVMPGFTKAVRLACSLNFAVKLAVTQPDPDLLQEMSEVLAYYLHHSTVSQPIEFFHSLLMAFVEKAPLNLWTIQEEDPALFRYIADQGEETIFPRLAAAGVEQKLPFFLETFIMKLLVEEGECSTCKFINTCYGYFKWPRKEYACENVKALLRTVKKAAHDLRQDMAAYHKSSGENRP
jgi:hypothetical protein